MGGGQIVEKFWNDVSDSAIFQINFQLDKFHKLFGFQDKGILYIFSVY